MQKEGIWLGPLNAACSPCGPRYQAPAGLPPCGKPASQQLALKFEAELTLDFGTVVGRMQNPHTTPLSLVQEMVADGHSFAAAYVDFQSRLLMPLGALPARRPQPSLI